MKQTAARQDPKVPPSPTRQRVDDWRSEVSAIGAPDTLLWSADGVHIDLTNAHPGGLARLLADGDARITQLFREPAAQGRALERAAVLRSKEIELDRERGVPGCYLAFGTARWGADSSGEPAAPVFLRRCRLRPTDAGARDYDVELAGQFQANPALVTYLRAVHAVDLDFDALLRLSHRGHGFDPTDAYAMINAAATGIDGWRISATLRLGAFHVAKVAAVTDFARAEEKFATHPVLGQWLADSPLPPPRDGVVADPINPDEIFVLDADPGQVAVLEAVRSGASLVIDSGPGTGKAQTIVNLAADLARVGARTLIVAPTRGARAAIAGRFAHLGLAHLLHEPVADGARWSAVTAPGHDLVGPPDDPDPGAIREARAAWAESREVLHAHVVRMHGLRRPWGVSLDRIQSRLVELTCADHPPRSRVRLGGAALAALDQDARDRWATALTKVAETGVWAGNLDDDPWWGADVLDATDAQRARVALAGLSSTGLARMQSTFAEVFDGVAVPSLPTLGHYRDFVVEMDGIRAVLDVFRLGIFETRLEEIIAAANGGPRERRRLTRAIKGLLRPGATPEQGIALLDRAHQVRPLWQQVRASAVMPAQVVDLPRAQAAYDVVAAHVHVLAARLLRPPGSPSLYDVPLRDLTGLVRRLTDAEDRLDVLAKAMPTIVAARSAGLGALVEDLAARQVPPERVRDEVDLVWWASILQAVTAADPGYANTRGRDLRSAAARFRAADTALQHALADDLARTHSSDDPPVWLVSPYAVGLLVPDDLAFDAVVIDEAGSVTAATVAAAIARAPQAVIVGDSRLPGPQPFTAAPGGRVLSEPGTSVLDLARRTLPVRRLGWHYRSHDHRLVAATNALAYGGALRTFPAPRGVEGVVVEAIAVPDASAGEAASDVPASNVPASNVPDSDVRESGAPPRDVLGRDVPEGGTPGGATAEGDALARAAVDRVVAWLTAAPRESVGIVVSGSGIGAEVAKVLRDVGLPILGERLRDDLPEPVTVIEAGRAAGETRDGIVLVLRAGDALEPSSLTAALGGARARLAVLHDLPEHDATRSPLLAEVLNPATGEGPDVVSVHVADLARRLRARGLSVVTSYGAPTPRAGQDPADVARSGVEMAVFDPFAKGGWVVAVELDGPAYARAGGVRMRERIRVAQLHRLGWRVITVATVDLFRDPAREEARIVSALEGLRARKTVPAGTPKSRRAAAGPATVGDAAPLVTITPASTPPAQSSAQGPTPPSYNMPADTAITSRRRRPVEQTRDDTDAGWGERPRDSAHDHWLEENRPPHWE